MACEPLIFTHVTRDRFQAIRARIRAQADVEIVGDLGTAQASGFKAEWVYKEPTQTLEIQILSKPFFVSEQYVASKIRDLVNGAA